MTLIVNYQHSDARDAFINENKDILNRFDVIWVQNVETPGVRVDFLPV